MRLIVMGCDFRFQGTRYSSVFFRFNRIFYSNRTLMWEYGWKRYVLSEDYPENRIGRHAIAISLNSDLYITSTWMKSMQPAAALSPRWKVTILRVREQKYGSRYKIFRVVKENPKGRELVTNPRKWFSWTTSSVCKGNNLNSLTGHLIKIETELERTLNVSQMHRMHLIECNTKSSRKKYETKSQISHMKLQFAEACTSFQSFKNRDSAIFAFTTFS